MAGIKIEIQGLEGLRKKFERLPAEASEVFEAALVKEATAMMNDSQHRVPVLTGRLRSSARVATENAGRFRRVVTLAYEAPYAIFVHAKEHWANGARYPAYHWFQKAVEKRAKGLSGRLVREVRSALAKKYPGLAR